MKNIAVIFGGMSAEHQISLISAQNIVKSLNRDKYVPILIAIDQNGKWFLQKNESDIFITNDPKTIKIEDRSTPVLLSPISDDHQLYHARTMEVLYKIDIIYPILHGTYGEDGAIQGLSKLMNIPCVGCGILGSAVGMDKEIMKRILDANNISNAPFVMMRKNEERMDYNFLTNQLGNDLFVKPANMGSSVGISHLKNESEYENALNYAFEYDDKILIESRIFGREIECAVMGNENPLASVIGEIIPKGGFYSFHIKYIDVDGALLVIPASLSEEEVNLAQETAINTYKALECKGLTRVDMFLTAHGRIFVNEVNTMPGFTNLSMYPLLWKEKGIETSELVDQLIDFAIQEHKNKSSLEVVNLQL